MSLKLFIPTYQEYIARPTFSEREQAFNAFKINILEFYLIFYLYRSGKNVMKIGSSA